MQKTIKERDIDSVDLRQFDLALAVRPGDQGGIQVWRTATLPPFSSELTEAKPAKEGTLLIEVDDPNDAETRSRLTTKLNDRFAK